MFLRELLPRYPFWPPRARKPIYPQRALDLHRVLGFTRQYCYEIWKGKVPPKTVAWRILKANDRAEGGERLQLEAILACKPHKWPEKQRIRSRLASRRLRRKLRRLERIVAEMRRAQKESKAVDGSVDRGIPPINPGRS